MKNWPSYNEDPKEMAPVPYDPKKRTIDDELNDYSVYNGSIPMSEEEYPEKGYPEVDYPEGDDDLLSNERDFSSI